MTYIYVKYIYYTKLQQYAIYILLNQRQSSLFLKYIDRMTYFKIDLYDYLSYVTYTELTNTEYNKLNDMKCLDSHDLFESLFNNVLNNILDEYGYDDEDNEWLEITTYLDKNNNINDKEALLNEYNAHISLIQEEYNKTYKASITSNDNEYEQINLNKTKLLTDVEAFESFDKYNSILNEENDKEYDEYYDDYEHKEENEDNKYKIDNNEHKEDNNIYENDEEYEEDDN